MPRYVRFLDPKGRTRWGLWQDERTAVPLASDMAPPCGKPQPPPVEDQPVPIARLLPPVPVLPPPNVFAIGLNYRQHAAETGATVPDHPLIFIKASTAVIGPGDAITLPGSAPHEVDFEAELAVVMMVSIPAQAASRESQSLRSLYTGCAPASINELAGVAMPCLANSSDGEL